MKTFALSFLLVAAVGATTAIAAVPAGAPAGTTGMCKDGSYSSSAEKKGACNGHKGVKDWYAEAPAAAAPPATSTTSPPTATTTTPKSATPAAAQKTAVQPTAAAPAPGGGAGKVWANTSTKVYHCPGAKYYGTTKQGEYMSESDAKAKGYHADHAKACA